MAVLLSDVINLFKVATFVVYFVCIVYYDLWDSQAAWMLLATHGAYGLMWTSKTWFGYADKKFEVSAPLGYLVVSSIALALYWLPMVMIVRNRPTLPPPMAALAVTLFGWGVYFHFAADLHKTIFIQQRESLQSIHEIIAQEEAKIAPTEGSAGRLSAKIPKLTFLRSNLFALSRNPNYFGELLIYLSFAVCSMSVYPVLYLLCMMVAVWLPNMRKKDASLSRFGDEYRQYSRDTAKMVPFLW